MLLEPDDEHNRALLDNAHPRDWPQPVPTGRYNLVVLGAGTAGLVSAAGGAGLGGKVALIERGLLGGDCLNVGCVPSKALLRSAKGAHAITKLDRLGIHVEGEARVDFARVMERLRRLRAHISPNDSAARFRGLGVDVYFGSARFAGPNAVEVAGQTLEFHRALIATGARAALPEIAGLEAAQPYTNETIFNLTDLPRRLAVLGGGPIGAELAQAFARLGSQVTLLQRGPRLLPRDEADLAAIVERALLKDGVRFEFDAKIHEVRRDGAVTTILFTRGPSASASLEVDAVLVATGRRPNVEGLNLEGAGVQYGPQGVQVDDHLRTSNSAIYAAGDICSEYKFTHAADAMARIALRNALFLGRARASDLLIPWCTYTDPEIARVGLSAVDADRLGVRIRTFEQRFEHVDRALLDDETEGLVRIHVRAGTDTIVGASIVAPHAGDMISELTLAMQAKVGLGRLSSVIHPYPTQAEAIKRCGDAYQKTRLTPWVASLFRRWLALRR